MSEVAPPPGFTLDAPPPPPGFQIDPPAKPAGRAPTAAQRAFGVDAQHTAPAQDGGGGAFVRRAAREVLPTAGGMGGFGAGFATAGVLGSPLEAVPVVGPVLHGAAATVGGLLGAMGAGWAVDKAQDAVLSELPTSLVHALGQDKATQLADEQQHPFASFAGGLAPSLITMRPGVGAVQDVPEDASMLTRALAHPAASHVIGAAAGGGMEAGREAADGGGLSPGKIALATGAGAALNRPTEIGDKLFRAGGNAAIRGMQRGAEAAGNVYRAVRPEPAPDFENMRRATEHGGALPAPEPPPGFTIDQPEPLPAASARPAPLKADPQPPVAEPHNGGTDVAGLGASAEPQATNPVAPEPLPEGARAVRTPSGATIHTRMGVVDASALTQAQGANQNRDRGRDTTDMQVQDIVSKFDPELLHEDPSTDRGAPIVGPDMAIDSGNGRVLALNKIYDQHPEQAAAYRSMIEGRGFSTEGMDRPILVQHRLTDMTPDERRQFIIDSNKDTKLELSPVERARSDADGITPDMLAKYAGGDLNSSANAGFVQAFNKRLTAGEMGNMIGSDRRLTTAGHQRIENAVVASAYGKPKLLERMMESTHDDIRSLTGPLADVAGPWARMRAAVKDGELEPHYDITNDLADAAARVSDARKSGAKPADILAQSDAFDQMSPVTAELVRAFHNSQMTRAASRKAVSGLLGDYVKAAQAAEKTDGLFGAEPPKAPVAILKELLAQRDNPNGDGLQLDAPTPKETNNVATRTPSRSEGAPEESGQQAQEAAPSEGRGGEPADEGSAPAESAGGDVGRRVRAPKGADVQVGDEGGSPPDYKEGRGPAVVEDASPYDPDFATASFTNRASVFNSAAEALGMDPDRFHLLPPARQVGLLRDALKAKYGVEVVVDEAMQKRFAIDQMLDAYQNVQGMAHVLDLPERAISLGGKLRLKLQNSGKFLGAFSSGQNLILLPRRSNSFSHEWGHALDWHLLGLTTGEGKGLSGAIRQRGDEVKNGALAASVRDAFVDLLNAMFFDKAGVASTIMELEAKIAQTSSAKVKTQAEAQIRRLKGGSSQAKSIRTAFYKGAKSYDGEGGDYWTSPTEMFARAFEAYVSYKAEAAGLTTEFIGKGDAGYLSNAEERFAKTFPKGEERAAIFAAFEQLFGHMAGEATLGKGAAAEKPGGSERKLTDYDKTPPVRRERGIIQRERTAIRRKVEQARKEAAGRPDSPKGVGEKIADLNGATFMSMTGNLRMIQGRSGSPSLQRLIDLLTKQDGKGERTVARTFAEDVHLQGKAAVNRLNNILKANGLEHRTAGEDVMLRDLLTGALDPDGTSGPFDPEGGYDENPVAIPGGYVKAAAAIRHLLDNEFYVNQKAGIDLGYTRNGYLNRALDIPKVYHDPKGFTRQAAKVYEHVFDAEFGKEPDALLGDEDTLPRFMKLAGWLAKQGHDIPSLSDVRALLKKINKLSSQAAKSDEPDALNAQVAKLSEELSERFGELFDEVRPAFAQGRAEAWLAKINLVAGEEHNASSPDSKYIKKRELPPEADKLMEKFFLSDPVESVTNYLHQSARRTAYARRFGSDGKVRKQLFEGMAAEGVSPEDQITAERILDTATGRMRSNLPRAIERASAFVNASGTMALLPRAVLSSLAEQFTAGLVTGDPRSGFKMLGMMIGSALGSPSGRVRFELARAMGIVSDLGSDDIMMARYGQTYADQTRWDRYSAEMFEATGLTALTRAQKTAGVGLGHAFLDNLAGAITSGKGSAKENALALMRELGIRDPEAFSKEMLATGRLPALEDLETPYGHDYATAQLRFSSMVVQEPNAMDRPELAHNPVGRVIYGITGFSYGYWRNIVKRNGILIAQMYKRDPAKAALYASALVAGAAVSYLLNLTISTIRERLLNPNRWDDLKHKGTLDSTMAQLAFTRAFSFGAADMVIQTYSGLKYQRDLSNAFVGPGPGFMLQNAQKISKLAVSNSRKTNTAEFNAAQGAYSLVSPFLAFAFTRIPGGPLITAAKGAALGEVTSAAARDEAAGLIAGKKQTLPGERHGTGYDRMLEALDPTPPKE